MNWEYFEGRTGWKVKLYEYWTMSVQIDGIPKGLIEEIKAGSPILYWIFGGMSKFMFWI